MEILFQAAANVGLAVTMAIFFGWFITQIVVKKLDQLLFDIDELKDKLSIVVVWANIEVKKKLNGNDDNEN